VRQHHPNMGNSTDSDGAPGVTLDATYRVM